MQRVMFQKYEMTEMAQFISELARQGVTYSVLKTPDGFSIELTGGY